MAGALFGHPPIRTSSFLRSSRWHPFLTLVEREVERLPTDIHFVRGLLALWIEVVRCPPNWHNPLRSHGIRHTVSISSQTLSESTVRVICSWFGSPRASEHANLQACSKVTLGGIGGSMGPRPLQQSQVPTSFSALLRRWLSRGQCPSPHPGLTVPAGDRAE